MALDVPQAAVLLNAPLSGHPVEELGIDSPVQLVHIHGVDALLEAIVLPRQPGDGLLMVPFLVGVALAQRLADPGEHFVIKGEPAEHLGELLLDDFLAYVGFPAFPPVAGAVVVDIPLLLDLPDDRTATVPALDEP